MVYKRRGRPAVYQYDFVAFQTRMDRETGEKIRDFFKSQGVNISDLLRKLLIKEYNSYIQKKLDKKNKI
jgi:hypothetical protein